jgi:2-amino-4-hydroxy-6-hydroxymethyldihydropteridine diphosphokinase
MGAKTAYLGLGSNLGNREDNLRRAIEAIRAAGIVVRRQSSIYETAPMLVTDQPWFLNLALEAQTSLFPLQLLHQTQAIEKALGRKRGIAKGPRTIDIDLLLYGRSVIQSQELAVPHPGLSERRFVLEPLCELAPALRHPDSKRSIRELLNAAEIQRQVTRLWRPERPGL